MKKWLYIFLGLFVLLVLAGLLLPDFAGARSGPRSPCMQNLSQIGKALAMYSMDHHEQLPLDLQTLAIEMNLEPRFFVCPRSGHKHGSVSNLNEWTDYAYVSGLRADDKSDLPVVFGFPSNHKGEGANVLYVDGSVCWLNTEQFTIMPKELYDQLETVSNRITILSRFTERY